MLRFAPLLAALVVLLSASSAVANSIWTEDCNLNPKSNFALDELVCGMGDVDTPCNNSIIGAADIWIVPAGAPHFTLAPGSTPKHIVTAGGGGGWSGDRHYIKRATAVLLGILTVDCLECMEFTETPMKQQDIQ